MNRVILLAGVLTLLAGPAVAQAPADSGCPYNERLVLSQRVSPLDSLTFRVGDATVKVCYGRPSARGRTMIGGEPVPFGEVWRTGANETTKILSPVPLSIAGIEVLAGTHALYTVPGAAQWEIIVNRAWEQWGHERYYTDDVKAQDVGRAKVPVDETDEHVEMFTIRAEPQRDGAVHLVLEWERSRVTIPVRAAGPHHGH